MEQYKSLLRETVDHGIIKPNRTGVNTLGIIGAHRKFNMDDGFPMVSIKQTFWKQSIAEMLGFLRGYTSAEDFRKLGCTVWDENANGTGKPGSPNAWLTNPYRAGTDDLGAIYGAQARNWSINSSGPDKGTIDQLAKVYDDLKQGIDNRREIVSHWNPAEMHMMALPPCHMFYQFGIQGDELHLSMYQRSCDMGLGVPFNIVGYSWLLKVMAQITGLKAGTFNHFMHDVHIYENHIDQVGTMLARDPLPLPKLHINEDIKTLRDLETWVTVDDFMVTDYNHHGYVQMDMAI